MSVVPLRFIPPERSGFNVLEIYESSDPSTDPGTLIESVTVSEPYPDSHTTDDALSQTDYFAIRWLNADGSTSEFSEWLKGGTETLVGVLVERMLLRDPSLNENIAAQEAEAAISYYFNVDDPATIDPTTVNPKILQGLTLLALGWSYTFTQATSGTTQKFTAGLVSLDSGTSSTTSKANIDELMKLANTLLGRNFTAIMCLKELPVAGGYKPLLTTVDLSRTMIEI